MENAMACRTRRHARARVRARRAGFTLIELLVVILVLSIIMSIAMANFIRFRTRAGYASCISNQRHVLEASTLYISETNPGTVAFDVVALTGSGYLTLDVADCPNSLVHAQNDYRVHVTDNAVTQIDCKIKPAEHQWNLP